MHPLAELQSAVATVARTVGTSVVAVGPGAGWVIAPGHLLTNAHNVASNEVPVHFADGRSSTGEATAADVDHDLAVVRADTGDLAPVPLAAGPPELGTTVLAVGAPRRGPGRVTVGFVSAVASPFRGPRGRLVEGVEHTAPMGRGSSGGPLVDLDGRVVGLNTHRRGDGFYLAVPAGGDLASRVERLLRGESPTPRRLGIAVAPAPVARRLRAAVGLDERDGLLVREVEPHGPADRAGVLPGDLVVAVDGAPVAFPDDLLDRLARDGPQLTLGLVRGVSEVEVRVAPQTDP